MTAQPPPPSRYKGTSSEERNYHRIRIRQDTEANWRIADPILASGELAYTIAADASSPPPLPGQCLKVGDGVTKWSKLPYLAARGDSGPAGPMGPAGHGIDVFGPSALPPLYGVDTGDVWLSTDPSKFAATFDPSTITVPLGPPGPAGPQGQSAFEVWKATSTAPAGATVTDYLVAITGPAGPKGDEGPAGKTFTVRGVVVNEAALPASPIPLTVMLAQDTGSLFIFDHTSPAASASGWVNLGRISGPAGPAAWMSAPVATPADLPAAGAPGQMIFVVSNGHLYGWNEVSSSWVDGGRVGSNGVADGTTQGDMLTWDATGGQWVSRGHVPVVAGTNQGDILRWNGTTGLWEAVAGNLSALGDVTVGTPVDGQVLSWLTDHWEPASPKGKFLGALALPPAGQADDVFYLTTNGDYSIRTATTTSPAAVAFDPRMVPVLAAGSVPDPADPSQALQPVQSLDSSWHFVFQGKTYHVVNTARLISRINTDGETSPLQWLAGASPPIAEVPNALSTKLHYNSGFYRHDGTAWLPINLPTALSALQDVDLTTPAVAGQALVYDGTKWRPNDVPGASPIVFLGTGAWDGTAALDGTAPLYGMPAGTTPSPVDYPPIPGDSYVDLATGRVTTFTGAVTTKRTGGAITGGGGGLDIIRERLQDLDDVSLAAVANGNILQYDSATSKWANKAIDAYTKSQTDQKLSNLVSSIEHEEAVLSIASTPPGGPQMGDVHIVGAAGTGSWAGQDNNLARWTGSSWSFEAPRSNESHLVEDVGEIWHWNGTAWVKISTAVAGSSARSGVGEIIAWIHGTIPAEYLPCDGRVVAIASYTDLHNIIGNTYNAGTAADGTTTFALPDLRGYFLRGSGTNGDGTAGPVVGQKQGQATARPGAAFTTDSQGNHHHTVRTTTPSDLAAGWHSVSGTAFMGHTSTNSNSYDINTGDSGGHTHSITGGGDSETRPKNIGVTWVIRWKAINGGAAGPKGEKGDSPHSDSVYMVGDIKQSLLDETQFKALLTIPGQWVLADGRNVAGSAYARATGSNTVPDLRGAFLRMAGQNTNASWTGPSLRGYQEDSTARPKTAFTTDSHGDHYHSGGVPGNTTAGSYAAGTNNQITVAGARGNTGTAGAHTHTITGGGDSETRPKSFGVNYFIKIN